MISRCSAWPSSREDNDPEHGIKTEYVDPPALSTALHEDPNFGDLVYAGHVKYVTIGKLKRLAG